MSDVTEYNVYQLANMADCQTPDSPHSPGAKFLLGIQNDVRHLAECGELDQDILHEIADNAPNVYTYPRWQEFVDLGAWLEDLTDLGGSSGDMTQDAAVCLYIIADRLAQALANEIKIATT